MRGVAIGGVACGLLVAAAASAMGQSTAPRAPEQPAVAKPVDPAPCVAAIAATDDDRIISNCAAVIGSDANAAPDRLKALLARAAAYARKSEPDRAIADYTAALKYDPFMPDVLNARGELWRLKGERSRAVMDFAAALRIDPQHAAARANQKSLAQEIERLGVGAPARPTPKGP